MLKYEVRNKNPLVKQIDYAWGRNHLSLYKLDREFAIEKEKLTGRDLTLYDRDIELQKRKEWQKKEWLIRSAQKYMDKYYEENKELKKKDLVSFKLSFNEFNGYVIEFNGDRFETFNYLFDDYIEKIFLN